MSQDLKDLALDLKIQKLLDDLRDGRIKLDFKDFNQFPILYKQFSTPQFIRRGFPDIDEDFDFFREKFVREMMIKEEEPVRCRPPTVEEMASWPVLTEELVGKVLNRHEKGLFYTRTLDMDKKAEEVFDALDEEAWARCAEAAAKAKNHLDRERLILCELEDVLAEQGIVGAEKKFESPSSI